MTVTARIEIDPAAPALAPVARTEAYVFFLRTNKPDAKPSRCSPLFTGEDAVHQARRYLADEIGPEAEDIEEGAADDDEEAVERWENDRDGWRWRTYIVMTRSVSATPWTEAPA